MEEFALWRMKRVTPEHRKIAIKLEFISFVAIFLAQKLDTGWIAICRCS